MRASGERGRGDEKLQATISLSVKRLENYMRVSWMFIMIHVMLSTAENFRWAKLLPYNPATLALHKYLAE